MKVLRAAVNGNDPLTVHLLWIRGGFVSTFEPFAEALCGQTINGILEPEAQVANNTGNPNASQAIAKGANYCSPCVSAVNITDALR